MDKFQIDAFIDLLRKTDSPCFVTGFFELDQFDELRLNDEVSDNHPLKMRAGNEFFVCVLERRIDLCLSHRSLWSGAVSLQ